MTVLLQMKVLLPTVMMAAMTSALNILARAMIVVILSACASWPGGGGGAAV